jgi:hypothetical protein
MKTFQCLIYLSLLIFSCQTKENQSLTKDTLPKKNKAMVENIAPTPSKIDSSKLNIKPIYKIQENTIEWTVVDTGLWLAEIDLPKSFLNDSKATVIKINPHLYDLKLFNKNAKGEKQVNKNAEEWAKEKGLILATNAGMFDGINQEGHNDGETNRGLMLNYDYVNNPILNQNWYMKAVLAFNPKEKNIPPVKIIDLVNENWLLYKDKYHSFIQCLRLIDARRQNVWFVDNKKWSMSIVVLDSVGNLLFIFTRSPYTMYQHINNLLALPLGIQTAMYLEGGPEASLYFSHNGINLRKFGSYETGFVEADDNQSFWDLPNVLGILKK